MRKLGNLFIVFGILMLLSAGGLSLWNQAEDAQAGDQAAKIVAKLQQNTPETKATDPNTDIPDPYDPEMTEVEVEGFRYIGYLQLPNLDAMLPVMSDWSYPQLQIAPCRYYGSTKTDDLVIMAHNFKQHFGKIGELKAGDQVFFLDMDDIISKYEVIAIEAMDPTAVEDMTSGKFDLTLFTCTYGGQTRIAVRCDRIVSE